MIPRLLTAHPSMTRQILLGLVEGVVFTAALAVIAAWFLVLAPCPQVTP
jgi:hypothetical protein